jgi:hypothetical protein
MQDELTRLRNELADALASEKIARQSAQSALAALRRLGDRVAIKNVNNHNNATVDALLDVVSDLRQRNTALIDQLRVREQSTVTSRAEVWPGQGVAAVPESDAPALNDGDPLLSRLVEMERELALLDAMLWGEP